jgi:tetratricopeptide (TPR) repeat protein
MPYGLTRLRINDRRVMLRSLFVALAVAVTSSASTGVFAQDETRPVADSRSFEELANRARQALDANHNSEAIRLFERAVELRPTWSEGWWSLGTVFYDASQFAQAHDAFLHFVTVEHTQAGPGYGMLGLTEFQLKDYQKARIAFERGIALGLGDNAEFAEEVLYDDGIVNNLVGQPEFALIRLKLIANRIAAAHPQDPVSSVLADTRLLDAFGLAALRMQKLPTEIPEGKAKLVREAGVAQAYVAELDNANAGKEIRQIVAGYPSEPGVHYMYGVFLLKEDPPSAPEQFRQEIAISPRDAAARIQLALEFLRVSDYKQGLKYAQEAIALVPDNFVAHVACGRLWLGLGNSDRALHELHTAVKLSPGSPEAHFALSRALTEAGKTSEAALERKEFERLKALANKDDRER